MSGALINEVHQPHISVPSYVRDTVVIYKPPLYSALTAPNDPTDGTGNGGGTYTPSVVDVSMFAATCGDADAVGNLVTNAGAESTVRTASAYTNDPVIGIIVKKGDATSCTVQRFGYVKGLFTDLAPGALYFLGPNGQPIVSDNFDPSVVYVQQIGQATTASELNLQPLGTTYCRSL